MSGYIAQIVPAPKGWVACGSPEPGVEFWYESTDGIAQVFPHPDSGWELQVNGSESTVRVAIPAVAFRLYEDYRCDFPQDRDADGNLTHAECACPTEER